MEIHNIFFPTKAFNSFKWNAKLLTLLAIVFTLNACKDDDVVTPVDDQPINLCDELGLGNMDSNNVGSNSFTFKNNPNAPVDYVIDCFPRILVDATIEPGTVIEFGEDAGFYITGDGSLSAVGTSTNPIIMRGTSSTKGWWRGIAFGLDDIRNELDYVTIDGAGGLNTIQGGSSVALFDNTNGLKIKNTTISNSAADGFIKTGTGDLGAFNNNTFSNNAGYPMYIHADKLSQLDGTNSSYTNNGINMIRMAISPGSVLTVLTPQTWKKQGVPVIIDEGTLGIRTDLIIEPGFELLMRADCNIVIGSDASFNAVGTSNEPIIIRGEQDIQGHWEYMLIEGSNVLNRMEYVTIANGGRLLPFGAAIEEANLYIANNTENLTVSNCTFSKSLGCGIYQGIGTLVSLSNNIFTGNAGADICN